MQVFKACLKILRKNLPMLSIYVAAFLGLTVSMAAASADGQAAAYAKSRPTLAVLNRDGDTALLAGLQAHLAENAVILEIGSGAQAQQDALFFRRVDALLTIPAGFTEAFLADEAATIQKQSVPDSVNVIYADLLIDSYLNTARLYARHGAYTQAEIAALTADDLSRAAPVRAVSYSGAVAAQTQLSYYCNAAAYALLSLLVLGVSSTLLAFNKQGRKERTACAPVTPGSIHLQSLLANACFMLAVLLLVTACAAILFQGSLFTPAGGLFFLNMLALSLTGLSISYLVGTLVKARSAQSAIANVLALGMTFLSGGFVPQALLGENVLAVARFLPTYWYVRANDTIAALHAYDSASLAPVVYGYVIQLGFAAALVSLTLALSRRAQPRERAPQAA